MVPYQVMFCTYMFYRIWSNGINHLERFTEKTLRDVLLDHSKQFCSHYGAVMGLLHLGTQVTATMEKLLLFYFD